MGFNDLSGKAKNDKIDSHKIAGLIRRGTFPMAFVYPRDKRVTLNVFSNSFSMQY